MSDNRPWQLGPRTVRAPGQMTSLWEIGVAAPDAEGRRVDDRPVAMMSFQDANRVVEALADVLRYERWSEDLVSLVPEEEGDDITQEGIILNYLRKLTTERDQLVAWLTEQRDAAQARYDASSDYLRDEDASGRTDAYDSILAWLAGAR